MVGSARRDLWAALSRALERHLPKGCTWTRPAGGFLTWLRLADDADTLALREPAREAGVAYVPGPPFYADGRGRNELRLSFSRLTEEELGVAVERLAGVLEPGAQGTAPSGQGARAESSAGG